MQVCNLRVSTIGDKDIKPARHLLRHDCMMNPPHIPPRIFPSAEADAKLSNQPTAVPQTEHPAYRLAFQDPEFLLREDLRPVRFQLELLKTELLLGEAEIESTFVFYGSARIPSPEEVPAVHAAADTPEKQAVAQRLAAKSHYYEVARELARIASTHCEDVGAPSLGMNIVLPHEQVPNPYVTPGLSFQFHYFALRKMHFLMRAKAVAVFPGGFGTFDELFELLTLVQTGKVAPLPILIYGRDFWSRVMNFEALAEEGVIAPHDLALMHFVETAEEGWAIVKAHYEL